MFKKYFLKAGSSGYIAILLCVLVPTLFFGVKYVVDMNTKHTVELKKELAKKDEENKKRCAKEAALAVAENWNPGLTLTQQKDAVMKVADAVYNASLVYNDSVLGRAIPGLDIKKGLTVTSGSSFGGNNVKHQETASVAKGAIISYSNVSRSGFVINACKTTSDPQSHWNAPSNWNPYHAMWYAVDRTTVPAARVSVYDDLDETELQNHKFVLKHHDIYTASFPRNPFMSDAHPTNTHYSQNTPSVIILAPRTTNGDGVAAGTLSHAHGYDVWNTSSFSRGFDANIPAITYKVRNEVTNANAVQVSVNNDRICVKTDEDISYAVPAQCNVDIVVAIPTNGAASNVNNRDAASDTAGTPWHGNATTVIPENAMLTPIYQIGQACKNFVKNNFYHIRGVNMGLIPYSGKVSVSPDKTSYTAVIPQFNSTSFTNSNSSFMRGAFLYSTRGEKDARLTNTYNWNTNLVGCPIMCRRGAIETSLTYGNNQIAYGDLLSNANPNTDALRFRRMNLNPCYGGYANLLSMRCERTCTTYLPNPFYMVELTADMPKIYEMCNAMYPIYDPRSVSNFVFIPVTWANNFFQSWTNNPTASASTDVLSRQNKTTSGRKKAVILIVNKPDWFEPRELTYIGFDNDFSEFPMAESDKIRFDVNYSDTSRRFADGSSYNTNHMTGTYAGIKGIRENRA